MTGNDTDDDGTVEQQHEPDPTDQQSVSGRSDGGTADHTGAGGADQPQVGDTPPGESSSAESSAGESRTSGERLAWVVQIGGLVVLCLLALLATFRFYFAASQAIEVWISDDFVSVFQAAFNLLVLIASVYVVSVLVRRLG